MAANKPFFIGRRGTVLTNYLIGVIINNSIFRNK